eukprot:4032810-Pleurochrysis_carterae.AAC.1
MSSSPSTRAHNLAGDAANHLCTTRTESAEGKLTLCVTLRGAAARTRLRLFLISQESPEVLAALSSQLAIAATVERQKSVCHALAIACADNPAACVAALDAGVAQRVLEKLRAVTVDTASIRSPAQLTYNQYACARAPLLRSQITHANVALHIPNSSQSAFMLTASTMHVHAHREEFDDPLATCCSSGLRP